MDILSSEDRIARAKLAADTRWSKRFDWETSSLDDCTAELAAIRAEGERGGLIVQRRMSTERISTATCYNPSCGKPLDITSGRFAGCRTRTNDSTGIKETAYACSAACYLYMTNNFKHQTINREPVTDIVPDVVNNEAAVTKI